MKKHILPLTCEKKIDAVRTGRCKQTIRPVNPDNPKEVGDAVKFHGWEGRPYRSKWGWRAPVGEGYWPIVRTFKLDFREADRYVDDGPDILMLYKNKTIFDDCKNKWVLAPSWIREKVAEMDWFDSYDEMVDYFLEMYDKEDFLDTTYKAIVWDPDTIVGKKD